MTNTVLPTPLKFPDELFVYSSPVYYAGGYGAGFRAQPNPLDNGVYGVYRLVRIEKAQVHRRVDRKVIKVAPLNPT